MVSLRDLLSKFEDACRMSEYYSEHGSLEAIRKNELVVNQLRNTILEEFG